MKHQRSLTHQQYYNIVLIKQHYSLNGFIHIGTILTFEEICLHTKVAEWLEMDQYSKNMPDIFPYWYPLLWKFILYREDLLMHIVQHPSWITMNQNSQKTSIIYYLLGGQAIQRIS
jgi:hypothetical protein